MTLRKKYINSTYTNKTCTGCGETYPRDDQHFYRSSKSYNPKCIPCVNKRNELWKKNNTEKKKSIDTKYRETEYGYFKELYRGVQRSKHGSSFLNYEEFFQCWVEQQKVYGTKCPYYGFEMTRIKGINNNGVRRKATDTNISKDRILSNLPYCKDNLMFVSWKANNEKGNITAYIAKKYLQIINNIPSLKLITETEESIKNVGQSNNNT